MASSEDKELEDQLVEAGNKLLKPPLSVEDLRPLLDELESCLVKVEQSPPESTQNALRPSIKALVNNELLRHLDMDVKVAVASCISEITRITAPEAPYNDDQMKDIFQLIVSTFEKFETSNFSYSRRASILETVARVRSCVVMLDLECDALILEMFQHFMKAIRDFHSESVFASMETIMSMVLDESEDISPELLSPLLVSVEKKNQDVLPIAKKLAEKVLVNCTSKLKPCLSQIVKSLGKSMGDYSKIVSRICNDKSEGSVVHRSEEHLADERKLPQMTCSDEPAKVAKELKPKASCPEDEDSLVDKSPKLMMSNGISEAKNNDSLVAPSSPKHMPERSRNTTHTSKAKPDKSPSKMAKSETKPHKSSKKKRGRKPKSSVQPAEASEKSLIDSEEALKLPDCNKVSSKAPVNSLPEVPTVGEATVSPGQKKDTAAKLSSPTASQDGTVDTAPISPTKSLPDEVCPKKNRRGSKEKNKLNRESDHDSPSEPKGALLNDNNEDEAIVSASDFLRKESEGNIEPKSELNERMGKKTLSETANEDEATPAPDVTLKEPDAADSETKPLTQSVKNVDARSSEEETSGKKRDTAKKAKGKPSSEDDACREQNSKSVGRSKRKSHPDLEETTTPKSKRKQARMKTSEKSPSGEEHGEEVVGSSIKVWWPADKKYYKGIIDSFDPDEKKHRIVYTDGDVEKLNLTDESWEFVKEKSVSNKGEATELPSADTSVKRQRKRNMKMNSGSLTKPTKKDGLLKRDKENSTSKSKGKSTTSGSKLKNDAAPKSAVKPKNVTTAESKENTSKSSKKLKDDNPKAGNKSEDETPKIATKSKGQKAKLGSKPKDGTEGSKESKVETPEISAKSKSDKKRTSMLSKDDTKLSTESIFKDDDLLMTALRLKGKTPKTGKKSSMNENSMKGKYGKSKLPEIEASEKEKLEDEEKSQQQENETEKTSERKRRRKVIG